MPEISTSSKPKGRCISLSSATTMRLLPQAYPFIMLDRIKACYPDDGECYSIKNITLTDPVLSGHFPGYPIYPGVLVLEALIQNSCVIPTTRDLVRAAGGYEALLAAFNGSDPKNVLPENAYQYFLGESRLKNLEPIYPGSTLELESKLLMERDGVLVFKVGASIEGRDVAKGQLTVVRTLASSAMALSDKVT